MANYGKEMVIRAKGMRVKVKVVIFKFKAVGKGRYYIS